MSEPKIIKRNELGLIEGTTYQYTEDGLIDWRAMINTKFLVPNKQNFEKQQKPIPDSIEGLEDKDLLILLAGIKELAWLRGYDYVRYDVTAPSENCIVAVCSIAWISNYETQNRNITFSSIGDATCQSANGFGKMFLGPIAENRAFVRCVRNFLRVNILGQDEIAPKMETQSTEIVPANMNLLEQVMKEHNVTFELIKATLIKDKYTNAENFESVADIPRAAQLNLIGRIKARAEKTTK